jgi:hypothetical protein
VLIAAGGVVSLGRYVTPPVDTGKVTVFAGPPQRLAARRRSRPLLVGLLGLLSLSALLLGCAPESGQASPPEASADVPTASTSDSPSASPSPLPTDAVVPEPQPSPTAVGPATVTIVNYGSDAQGVHASGLVTGDAGAEGTCILTATSPSGESLSVELEATPTPAAMNCGLIDVPVTAGEWTLVLSYRSESGIAESAPRKVTK